MEFRDVEVVEEARLKRGRPTVVTGFAGPGFVASTAVMHIVRNKGLKMRAYVRSPLIPPMAIIMDGRPSPALRIYSSGDEATLLVASEVMPEAEGAWSVSHHLMDWLVGKGAESFVSIEGIPSGAPPPERTVYGFSTGGDPGEYGMQSTREGIVSGMNACLLDECVRRGLPWLTIFVPANIVAVPDYGGAAAAVEVLNRMFNFDADVSPLRGRDEAMRRALSGGARPRGRGLLGLRGRW